MSRRDHLSAKEAATLLGVHRSSFYARSATDRAAKRPRGAAASSNVEAIRFSITELLASDDGRRRREQADALALGIPDALVCDPQGLILGVGAEIERALQMAVDDLVGSDVRDLGVPFDPPEDDVTVRGALYKRDLTAVILRRRGGKGKTRIAPEVLAERREQTKRIIDELEAKYPRSLWDADPCSEPYPDLGRGTFHARVRLIRVGVTEETFRVYRFALPRLSTFLDERTGALVQARFAGAHSRFEETCKKLAPDMTATLSAESVTLFFFRHAFESREFDIDEKRARRPKALVAVAHHGFPYALGMRELFMVDEDSLVMRVLATGTRAVVDLNREDERAKLRAQNAKNYQLNSRFSALVNAIICPIALPSPMTTQPPRVFGAIRVLNCYRHRPDGTGPAPLDAAAHPDWMQELASIVEDTARRLALMYRTLLDAQRADVLDHLAARLTDEPKDDFFFADVAKAAQEVFEFDRVVLWRGDGSDKNDLDPCVQLGATRRNQFAGGCIERSSAFNALGRGRLVDLEESQFLAEQSEDARSSGSGLHNGFEIPIFRPDGRTYASLGLYDSPVIDAGDSDRETVKRYCRTFAKLIEARVAALADERGGTKRGKR